MNAILQRLLSHGLTDLEGLRINGSIPLTSELANGGLQSVLEQLSTGHCAPDSEDSSASIDPSEVLSRLEVKEMRVSFERDRAWLHLDVRR